MNRIKKNITVRFFTIEASEDYLGAFVSNFMANKESSLTSRIVNIKAKKHLIKLTEQYQVSGTTAYGIAVVKERNTWQTKATSDGKITGISLNQGIIGDPYYFFVIPSKKLLLGFTSGPSGSLKTVGRTMLEQFKNNRLEKIRLDLMPKENEYHTLNELPEYSSLHFRINSSSLSDISEDAPQLIKDLSSAPYIANNMQLSLDLELKESAENTLSRDNVLEIVNYLSEHEGCTVLKVRGLDNDGKLIHLDFGNAFISYKADIHTRNKFIDEATSEDVLKNALSEYIGEN